MTDRTKNVLDYINRWGVVIQIVVIAVPLAIFFTEMKNTMTAVRGEVKDIKVVIASERDRYVSDRSVYLSGIIDLKAALNDRRDDHKYFERGQNELSKTLVRLTAVMESIDKKLAKL